MHIDYVIMNRGRIPTTLSPYYDHYAIMCLLCRYAPIMRPIMSLARMCARGFKASKAPRAPRAACRCTPLMATSCGVVCMGGTVALAEGLKFLTQSTVNTGVTMHTYSVEL